MAPPLSREASFLCTFCWHPQFPPARPKVLGREARIACEPCWRSVLDLSICWVCGEMVGRGEEVVSLGWCFWHRGCFGCLLCGTHLDPPELREGLAHGVEKWEDEVSPGTDQMSRRVCRGVELENIPLCLWCENAAESMQDKDVLENGLINVSRKDGGLSRSRLALLTGLSEIDSGDLPRQMPRVLMKTEKKGITKIATSCLDPNHPVNEIVDPYHEDSSQEQRVSLLKDAAGMGMGEDGNLDIASGRYSPVHSLECMDTQTLYVSVLDVLNQPAFRPSKTKPIPKWMTLLPRNRQEEIDIPRPTPVSKAKSFATESASVDGNKSQGFRPTPGTANVSLNQPRDPINASIAIPISNDDINLYGANPDSITNPQTRVPHRIEIDSSSIHTSRKGSNPPFKRTDTPYPFAGTTYRRPIFNRPRTFPRPSQANTIATLPTHRELIIYPTVSTLAITPIAETT